MPMGPRPGTGSEVEIVEPDESQTVIDGWSSINIDQKANDKFCEMFSIGNRKDGLHTHPAYENGDLVSLPVWQKRIMSCKNVSQWKSKIQDVDGADAHAEVVDFTSLSQVFVWIWNKHSDDILAES